MKPTLAIFAAVFASSFIGACLGIWLGMVIGTNAMVQAVKAAFDDEAKP